MKATRLYQSLVTFCDGSKDNVMNHKNAGAACKRFYAHLVQPVNGTNDNPEAVPHVQTVAYRVVERSDGKIVHEVIEGPHTCACGDAA